MHLLNGYYCLEKLRKHVRFILDSKQDKFNPEVIGRKMPNLIPAMRLLSMHEKMQLKSK